MFKLFKKICIYTYTLILTLFVSLFSNALSAALPQVEQPKSATDGTFYGNIQGYLNDAIVLGGLVVAACAFLVVAYSAIQTFAEVRDGKSTWAKFGMFVVIGIVLVVAVIWFASQSATVML